MNITEFLYVTYIYLSMSLSLPEHITTFHSEAIPILFNVTKRIIFFPIFKNIAMKKLFWHTPYVYRTYTSEKFYKKNI